MDRRLTRSRDAMIGGVAAGLANWLNADPALVRIAWALLVPLTGGAALLAYIVAWIVVPEEPRRPVDSASASPQPAASGSAGDAEPSASAPSASDVESGRSGDRTALYIGGGLVLIGLWFLVREYVPDVRWDLIWPLLLVGFGALILVTAARRR
jgi:phage shock protein C